jgi:hypothetical protein
VSFTPCHFDSTGRPYIWIQAPELIVGPLSALVDTGFDGTVMLPAEKLPRGVTASFKGVARRFTGEETQHEIVITNIVFNVMSRQIPCGVAQASHAVVGVLFLEAFQQTLVIYKHENMEPVAVLVDTPQMIAVIQAGRQSLERPSAPGTTSM